LHLIPFIRSNPTLAFQRWIYRIDPKRINEYGQVMAADADAASSPAVKGAKKGEETKKNQ
jgi:hypothetical protein